MEWFRLARRHSSFGNLLYALPEHTEGHMLHQGVHRHHQVRLVEVEGHADLVGDE